MKTHDATGRPSPVLRRAVMRVQPEFYGWDEARQLHYRMHNTSELTPLERRESDLLNEQHRDIARNFNPKVVRLKKRRKILLHKDAFR